MTRDEILQGVRERLALKEDEEINSAKFATYMHVRADRIKQVELQIEELETKLVRMREKQLEDMSIYRGYSNVLRLDMPGEVECTTCYWMYADSRKCANCAFLSKYSAIKLSDMPIAKTCIHNFDQTTTTLCACRDCGSICIDKKE